MNVLISAQNDSFKAFSPEAIQQHNSLGSYLWALGYREHTTVIGRYKGNLELTWLIEDVPTEEVQHFLKIGRHYKQDSVMFWFPLREPIGYIRSTAESNMLHELEVKLELRGGMMTQDSWTYNPTTGMYLCEKDIL